MITRKMSDGSVLHVHPKGAMQFHDLGKGVVLHVCAGVSVGEFAPLVIADTDRLLREYGRVIFFVDTYDGVMTTTEFRETMTEQMRRMGDKTTTHLLLRSKLWRMALNVAQLMSRSGTLHSYSDVAEWEAAGRREIPSFARKPLVLPEDLRDGVSFT